MLYSNRYSLDRFVLAQEQDDKTAREELRQGKKLSHWMWYIFPQLRGLGHSAMAQHYGLSSLDEAIEYLAHPLLGTRLRELATILLELDNNNAISIFGSTDARKLQSSLTLFDQATEERIFEQVLDKFYQGQRDANTLQNITPSKEN